MRASQTSALREYGYPERADDGIRTRDPHLGKVMRYQLRYVRNVLGKVYRMSEKRP
jgi:hypothetical protein